MLILNNIDKYCQIFFTFIFLIFIIFMMIYIPIFKTKQNVEAKILKKYPLFFGESGFIPYIEITKAYEDVITAKTLGAIRSIMHFEEFNVGSNKDFLTYEDQYDKTAQHNNVILSFRVSSRFAQEDLEAIENIIKKRKISNLSTAIRIPVGTPENTYMMKLLSFLGNDDWLFIDIDENEYDACTPYIKSCMGKTKAKVVITATERQTRISGSSYENKTYSHTHNTSLLASVIEKRLLTEYFGSYASLKNDLTDGVISTSCYAILTLYDLSKNMFYIIKSDSKLHVSHVYEELRGPLEVLLSETESIVSKIFMTAPISYSFIKEVLNKKKRLMAHDMLQVSLLLFLEQMSKLLEVQ